jgi:hypothetical protein
VPLCVRAFFTHYFGSLPVSLTNAYIVLNQLFYVLFSRLLFEFSTTFRHVQTASITTAMSLSSLDRQEPVHPGDITRKEKEAGILPSHGMFRGHCVPHQSAKADTNQGISLNIAGDTESGRPPILQHLCVCYLG